MVFSKKWLKNHPQFLLHFLIHIDVLMLCRKFELILNTKMYMYMYLYMYMYMYILINFILFLVSPAAPSPPRRETPECFCFPHVSVRFSIGGQLVTVSPVKPSDHVPATVHIHSIQVSRSLIIQVKYII